MPFLAISEIATCYKDVWTDLKSPADLKASNLARDLSSVIDTGFQQVKAIINIVGMIGSNPYTGVEPPFAGIFQKSILQMALQDGYSKQFQPQQRGMLSSAAVTESKFIANGLVDYFDTGIWQTTVHQGPPLTTTPLVAALIQPIIMQGIMSSSVPSTSGAEAMKANIMSQGIVNGIMAAIAVVTLSGAISSPPTGSGTGVLL